MRRNSTLILSFFFLLAAVFSLLGNFFTHPWLHDVFTPFATICILCIALFNWRRFKESCAFWICTGLFFSLLGDIALLRPTQHFLPGLVAFLVAHIAYLIAFTCNAKFPARFSIWLAYIVVAAMLYYVLLPGLPRALKLPVAAYAILLASMAGQAMGRYSVRRTRPTLLAAIGALLFLLSDTLLSLDRFSSALPYASLLILAPYFVGQWLIALSTAER
jgi:uncharacterized membrane protein YhhN